MRKWRRPESEDKGGRGKGCSYFLGWGGDRGGRGGGESFSTHWVNAASLEKQRVSTNRSPAAAARLPIGRWREGGGRRVRPRLPWHQHVFLGDKSAAGSWSDGAITTAGRIMHTDAGGWEEKDRVRCVHTGRLVFVPKSRPGLNYTPRMVGNHRGGRCGLMGAGRRHTSILMFAEGSRIWVEGAADLLLLLRIWGKQFGATRWRSG